MKTIAAAALVASLFLTAPAASATAEELTAHELNTTQKWLRSIGDSESGPLVYEMSFPFRFETTSEDRSCAGKYRSETSLKRWQNCMMRHEKLLMKLLTKGSFPELVYTLPMSQMNQTRHDIAAGGRWVPIYIEGDDDDNQAVGAYLQVLIENGKISTLLADILYME